MRQDKNGNNDHCRVESTRISEDAKEVVMYFKLGTNIQIDALGKLMEYQTHADVLRLLAMARTKYEEACMWAIKAVTSEFLRIDHGAPEQGRDNPVNQGAGDNAGQPGAASAELRAAIEAGVLPGKER